MHVLVDFPKLRDLRQQLRGRIGDKLNNISDMLGGKGHETLTAVLDFAEASQRFCSRVPVRTRSKVPKQSDQHRL
jgi:hypothetical protein